MIKRSTWIVLVVLVVVVAGYFVVKSRPPKAGEPTPTAQGTNVLIPQSEGTLQSVQIVDAEGNKFRMQRDMNKTWVITSPTQAEADQSKVGAAIVQINALRIVTALDTPPDPAATLLNNPADTVIVTLDTGAEHTIEIGGLTPTSSGYYVRFDKKKVYVISQTAIDSLLNLIKTPPYPDTPTPAVTDTPVSTAVTPTP